jgi:hypothetical protein
MPLDSTRLPWVHLNQGWGQGEGFDGPGRNMLAASGWVVV